MRAADIDERLRSRGEYARALTLLALMSGWSDAATSNHTNYAKLFHTRVLPEFATWLYSPEGRQQLN